MRTGRVMIAVALAVMLLPFMSTAAPAPASIKIGGTLAITGRFAAEAGPPALRFMQEWVKAVNEAGGVNVRSLGRRLPIELIVYDDESNFDKGIELYEKLAAVDKVDVFIGPFSSPMTLRVSTVAERLNIPMIAVEANDSAIYARGFRWLVGVLELGFWWSQHYFDMIKASNDQGLTRYRTVAVIAEDLPHTMDVASGAIFYARAAGLEPLLAGLEVHPFPTRDFSATIAKLRSLNPDIVFLALWGGSDVAFLKQAAELGLRPREMHVRFIGAPVLEGVGERVAEGLTGDTYMASKLLEPRQKTIYQRMGVDAYDYPWTSIRYAALEAWVNAIEKAGTLDRARLMETLRDPQVEFPAHFGTLRWNWGYRQAGQVLGGFGTQKPFVAQYQAGKLRVVWPPSLSDTTYRPARR